MAIDITNAMLEANLLTDSVIAAYAKHYSHSNGINCGERILKYNDDTENLKVRYTARFPDDTSEDKIVYFENNQYSNDNFSYNARNEDGPIKIFWISEPQEAGAHGVKVNIEDGTNYMFASGPLSGCSCAFLLKENSIYFIHSGASESSKRKIENPEERRKTILRDLYNNLMDLSGNENNHQNELLPVNTVVTKMNQNGFKGILVTASDNSFAYNVDDTSISVVEYFLKFGEWDVIAFFNIKRKEAVAVRESKLLKNEIIRGIYFPPVIDTE